MKIAVRLLALAALVSLPASAEGSGLACPEGQIRASGAVDETVFSRAASRGVRAEWCERYDALGRAERVGRYVERHPNGRVRLEATYRGGVLSGPVVAYHENGAVFLRGALVGNDWQGAVSLHHESGALFWSGTFSEGRLEGRVELRHPDGGLAAESRFQAGREDGAARSFHPRSLGGGLKSEVHVEADAFVGIHRVFDHEGKLILRTDRNAGPAGWSGTPPVAAPAAETTSAD